MKIKTKIALMSIIVIAITIFGYFYLIAQPKSKPIRTGGDLPQVVPSSYISEATAMAKLSESLPIETKEFTLTFNYKVGKYMVTGKDKIDVQSSFDKWYGGSGYTAIPKTRFILIN